MNLSYYSLYLHTSSLSLSHNVLIMIRKITQINPNVRGAPGHVDCTSDEPKIDPMHMPKHTLEDPMHGMQPFKKKLDLNLVSLSLLPFQLH